MSKTMSNEKGRNRLGKLFVVMVYGSLDWIYIVDLFTFSCEWKQESFFFFGLVTRGAILLLF